MFHPGFGPGQGCYFWETVGDCEGRAGVWVEFGVGRS